MIAYFLIAILWGIFAARMQSACYDTKGFRSPFCIFLLNAIFCPICMVIAIVRTPQWEKEEDSNS